MYPRQSPTTHTEQLGDEASVYDWARAQVHALNPTAAFVWRQCDGATSPDAIAAALRAGDGYPRGRCGRRPDTRGNSRAFTCWSCRSSRAVIGRRPPGVGCSVAAWRRRCCRRSTRSWRRLPWKLSRRGRAPTLTSVTPNQGILGTTVAVTLTGTNFVVGATTVNVSGGGVTVDNIVVGSATSLTANFVSIAAAAAGARTVTVTTAGGTSGGQTFTVRSAGAGRADADQRRAESRRPGRDGGGHADGHQFRRRRHDGGRQRCRRDGQHRRRGQHDVADRQLRARSGRRHRCPHGDGHDGRRDQRRANLHDHAAGAGRADAD